METLLLPIITFLLAIITGQFFYTIYILQNEENKPSIQPPIVKAKKQDRKNLSDSQLPKSYVVKPKSLYAEIQEKKQAVEKALKEHKERGLA